MAEGISADVFSCTFEGTLGAPPLLRLSCYFNAPPPPLLLLESRSDQKEQRRWEISKTNVNLKSKRQFPILQNLADKTRRNQRGAVKRSEAKLNQVEFLKVPFFKNLDLFLPTSQLLNVCF